MLMPRVLALAVVLRPMCGADLCSVQTLSYDRKQYGVLVSERPRMSVSAEWTRRETRDSGDEPDASSASADDRKKSKKQLLQELVELRQRGRTLEKTENRHGAVEVEPTGTGLGLRDLLAVCPAIICTPQASGAYGCTFVSAHLRAIMGYSPEEMTTDPKTWADHLHPEDATRVLKGMGPLIEQGGGTVEYRFRHRDGHYIWIQDTFRVIAGQTGHALELVGAWADITERKSIESQLIGTRQRLQYLLSVSPAIIYTTKASGDYTCTFVSDNLRHIMGYSPIEMTTDPKCWPDHLHPDDAARVIEEMSPLIEKGGGTLDYRFRHRDGHYIWIQDAFKVINDENGHPLELVGAWADISQSKSAEQRALNANAELQETKRYLSRLIESSTDAIFATDKAGNIVLFNEGAEMLLGYRAEDVIGKSWMELYDSEEHAKELLREMRKRGGTVAAFESALKTKDEKSVPVLVSASVLFAEHGEEVGTVGFATDLRTRKR